MPACLARTLVLTLTLLGITPSLRADWFSDLVSSDTDERTRSWSWYGPWEATTEYAAYRTYNARCVAPAGYPNEQGVSTWAWITGPGRVDFNWAIDAGPNSTFKMLVDGVAQRQLTGQVGNYASSVEFGGGQHTFSWVFANTYPLQAGSHGKDWVYLHQVTIYSQPEIYQYPSGSYAKDGQYVTVSARARGGNMSYNWYDQNGSYVTGGQSAGYYMSAARARMRLRASNGYGTAQETWFDNYFIQTPVMTSQPTSVVAATNTTVTFYANANNYQLTYQWYKSTGSAISGATSYYLYLYNVTAADEGGYYCRIANSAGSVQSSTATLTIATPPAITVQPVSITRNPGSSATFSVTATGYSPSYEWYKNSNVISGATSASYTIPNVVLADAGNFQVKVWNVAGTVWSSNAVLTTVIPPAITTQPASLVVTQNNSATFFVTATGSTAAYQWWKGSMGSQTLLYTDFSTNDGGFVVQTPLPFDGPWAYSAAAGTWQENGQATDNNRPNTSKLNTPTVTLNHAGTVRLTFAHRYYFEDYMDGGQVRVSINGGPYTAVAPAAFTQGRPYDEIMALITPSGLESELKGQICYSGMSFYYNDYPWERYETAVANLGTFNAGDTVSVQFFASANNTARATVPNWEIDSVKLQLLWNDPAMEMPAVAIPGATATNYTIASAQVADAAPYSVVLSNAAGSVTSFLATLTVLVPPVITLQPLGALLVAGAATNLSVTATGTVPLTYQWQFKNVPIAGATNSSLALSNLALTHSGPYRVFVSNVAGRATSAVATVTVMLRPSIVIAPSSVFTNLGAPVALGVTTASAGSVSYQWYFRNEPLMGATNATLTFANAVAAHAGDYWVRVRNAVAVVDSPRVWVVLGPWENHAAGWGDSSGGQTLFTSGWTNLVTLSAGNAHTLALRGDGSVLAAGANDFGQVTLPDGLSRSVGVAAGGAHSLALRESSTILAWGANDFGQTNVPAGLSNVLAVAAGSAHSVALLAGGTVTVFGGETADISTIPATATNVTAIAAAAKYTIALRRDGQAVVWGSDLNGLDILPIDATNLAAVAAGASHVVCLRADGAVVAWGDDTYGQATVPAAVSNAVAVAAGGYHSLAILADGSVVGWGAGTDGRQDEWPHVGQGTAPAEVTDATGIAAGEYFSVAAVPAPPRWLEPLANRVGYTLGQTVSLQIKAAGCLPLCYQWFKDGEVVPGATNASLTLANLGPYAGAIYAVTVSNLAGLITSGNLSLERDTPYDPLQITQQPQSVNTLRAAVVVLSVGVQGTGPLRFQWRKDGSPVAGATNDYYRAATAQLTDSAAYSVVVSNDWEVLTSDTAQVNVLDPPAWPESYTNSTMSAGQMLTITVDNTGSGPFDYEWYHNGQPLEGVNSNTLVIASLTWQNEGEYSVKISNPVGSITRAFFNLHVVSPPYLLTDLADVASPRGTNAEFFVRAGGEPPVGYQWYEGDTVLPDEFHTNMIIADVAYSHTNQSWFVVVTNFMGAITSRVARLSIIEPPTIITQPVSVVAEPNTEARFAVTCGGTLPLSYQWYLNGAPVAGGSSATLVISSVTAGKQGIYEVEVSNPAGRVTSDSATLAANVAPVALGVSVGRTNVAPGSNFELTARVAGVGPFGFQWYLDGVALVGQTNLTLIVSNAPPEAAGWYTFMVSNSYGDSTLDAVAGTEVRVVNLPYIESGPDDVLAILGRPATFSVVVRGTNQVSYQWLKESQPIAGATSSSYTVADPKAPDAGQYSVAVANSEGTTWSSLASLTFAKLPSITQQPANAVAAPGGTATFNVAVTSQFPVSYQWRMDGGEMPGQTNAALTITLPLRVVGWDHSYSVLVSSDVGRVSSMSAVLTLQRTPEIMLKHSRLVTQVLYLRPGWNAIYLTVQPVSNRVAEVFGDAPWTSVWMWRDRENPVQFIEQMTEAAWNEPDWLVNFQTNRTESFQNNLFRLFANQAYLVHLDATNDTYLEITGEPALDVKSWRPDSYNLTGLPIETGREPTAQNYFRYSPAHYDSATGQIKPIYRLEADGHWKLLTNDDLLYAGQAYWFYARGGSTYAGPVEVSLSYGRGLLFTKDVETLRMTLLNRTSAARRLWFSAHPLYAGGFPLMVREVTDQGVNFVEMPPAYAVDVPANGRSELILGADRLRTATEGFESVMIVSDDNGLGLQLPVLIEHLGAVTESSGRIQPNVMGLWVGQATWDGVSEVNSVTAITNRVRFTNDLGQVTNILTLTYTNTPSVSPTGGGRPEPAHSPACGYQQRHPAPERGLPALPGNRDHERRGRIQGHGAAGPKRARDRPEPVERLQRLPPPRRRAGGPAHQQSDVYL
jgi:hypothetical protein